MALEQNPVYIIGHKNPDTDSICSAIAYAALKNKINDGGYVAARQGQINPETQYVLNYFQVQGPMYLHDVKTDVTDIEIRKAPGVSGQIPIKRAWSMMMDSKVQTLAVTEGNKLLGVVTLGDLTKGYMDDSTDCTLSKAKTSYKNILETLNAKIVVGDEDGVFDNGKVLIAAANPDYMEDYIKKGDMIILGNRYESQLCAIEMDASCIVVSLDAKVSKTIQKLAKEHNCTIIVTPYDTFKIARLINQSMPIDFVMNSVENGLVTFKLTDKTDDIKVTMGQLKHRYFPVLDSEENYVGMISRRNLLNLRKKRVILVDHNEASQTVDGIESAEILEIIDHHRIGTLETLEPVLFRNQPVGCTGTIIYQMYKENNVEIPEKMAGMMMAAIISDTLMFRSPTCTPMDKAACEELSKICKVNIEEFAINMFSAGSDLGSKTPEEIFNQDRKRFDVGEISFSVAQISSMNSIELEEVKEKLYPYIKENFDSLGVNMCFVMLTNIVKEDTQLMCFGEDSLEVVREAFQLSGDLDKVVLKGLVSRKKQLIPSLVAVLQQK